ncbi:hypothetical protein CgunFtcFv8_013971 [Champsocephalus gunnari]|uniref:Uncharacterized protein n=1 Tax=Champsocephalus gunnari TaxID=52237 RepID=A0AAN8E536_CHAGU|nr:hypothetical protein CgunFtcFv8_013971 [Champsocephalus gunnari]
MRKSSFLPFSGLISDCIWIVFPSSGAVAAGPGLDASSNAITAKKTGLNVGTKGTLKIFFYTPPYPGLSINLHHCSCQVGALLGNGQTSELKTLLCLTHHHSQDVIRTGFPEWSADKKAKQLNVHRGINLQNPYEGYKKRTSRTMFTREEHAQPGQELTSTFISTCFL